MPTDSYTRADIMANANAANDPNALIDPNLPPEEQPLQMTDILAPTINDVLCGRGGAVLRHPGNVQYQNLIKERQQEYTTCMKAEKLKISRSIVEHVRKEYRGRFLVRDSTTKSWYDIGEKKAVEKTSQALREGQPKRWEKIRKAKLGGGKSKSNEPGASSKSLSSDDGTIASSKSKKFPSIKKKLTSIKLNTQFGDEIMTSDSSVRNKNTNLDSQAAQVETLHNGSLSNSERSNQTGIDSWGEYNISRDFSQNSNASTVLANNINGEGNNQGNLLPRRKSSDGSLDIDEELLQLSALEGAYEDIQVPTNRRGSTSVRRKLSLKSKSRGSLTTSSGRMSEFSAIGSKMSFLSVDDDGAVNEQAPATIWDANESGMPIDFTPTGQVQHEQTPEIDRRKMFARMKKQNRSHDGLKNSARPPLSTVVLDPSANESKESSLKAMSSSYTLRSMYKDSVGTFNPDGMLQYKRASTLSSKTTGNQSAISTMSVLTNLSVESIGTSIDLLSVCEAIQSIESNSVESKTGPIDVPTWSSNRSGFSGPPISILTENAGSSDMNDEPWRSNSSRSKDSKSNSSNSRSSNSRVRSDGKYQTNNQRPKSSKIPSRRISMTKNLSDISMGTFNNTNLSTHSFTVDEIDDASLVMDDSFGGGKGSPWSKLPTIEGSRADFNSSPLEMDVD